MTDVMPEQAVDLDDRVSRGRVASESYWPVPHVGDGSAPEAEVGLAGCVRGSRVGLQAPEERCQ